MAVGCRLFEEEENYPVANGQYLMPPEKEFK